ncbi:MAG TPA: IclR family transcriptional regulator C-terminal domain-containing protein [Solirubrobacteraceae bacterium]|jgi:IclR family pca regulon transcriptional regulator|nr:IclR family transcriptional regulator C-terminal domain-containing protein [Solirubrobacteraceae bacterium]
MTATAPRPAAPPREFVQSLSRGLAVMRALSGPRPLTLSDVARSSGLSRAAARRFLLTLEQLGYVRAEDGRFALTPRVLELGFAYLSALGLPELAQPHLERLVEEVRESSSVSVLDGSEIVYVARVSTRRIMNVTISVGTRFPAQATSMGRVLLADLGRERCEEILPLAGEELRLELDRVAAQGHAIVDQELESGLRSVAAPIRDRDGRVAAAVNLAVSAERRTVEAIRAELLPPLLRTAAAIERDLGARA